MSRGDWLFYIAVGGILAFGLAFVALQNERQAHCQRCESSAGQIGNRPPQQMSPLVRDGIAETPPANPKPNREEWRREQELEAQRSAANWAWGTMLLSILSVLVTGAGVIYVAKTLDANKAAVAAANRGSDIAKEIGEAQVRAYVSCQSADYILTEDSFSIILSIKNAGQSPAFNVSAVSESIILACGGTGVVPQKSPSGSHVVIQAGGDDKISATLLRDDFRDGDFDVLLSNPITLFLIRGHIVWEDVFQKDRSIGFLLTLSGRGRRRTGTRSASLTVTNTPPDKDQDNDQGFHGFPFGEAAFR